MTRSSKSFAICLLSAGALSSSPSLTHAQEQAESAWQYEITPYLWGAGLDGTTRVRDRSFNTSADFSDLLDSLDLGLMAAFEARKGRWGILFDGLYIELEDSGAGPGGRSQLEVTQQMYSLGAAWRASEGSVPVDVVGGLRYNYLKPRLDTPLGSVGDSRDALDPFIGVRGQFPLTSNWSFIGYTDIGTFKGGDWAWQLLLGANYAFNDRMTAKFGYRRYKIDYDEADFAYTNTMHGLYLGLGFHF